MRVTVKLDDLQPALDAVARIVKAQSPLPILQHALLTTADGRLTLATNNLELAITRHVAAQVDVPGRVTLPARLFAEFVGTLPVGQVTLEQQPNTFTVRVTCERYKANIKGSDPEDFPPVPTAEAPAVWSLPAAELRAAIQATAFAVAPDDSRPVLAGLLLAIKDDTLTLAAADGHRLAVYTLSLPDVTPLTAIIPAKALVELARALVDFEGDVEVVEAGDGRLLHLRVGDIQVCATRQIEGQFPDYQKVIPRSPQTHVMVLTADLQRAARAASILARDNSLIVVLEAEPADNGIPASLNVSATAAEIGDQRTSLTATVDGPALRVAVNGRYLLQAVEALGSDRAVLALTSATAPILLTAEGDTRPQHVIMPMQINQAPGQAATEREAVTV